jgi:hypothetical protein
MRVFLLMTRRIGRILECAFGWIAKLRLIPALARSGPSRSPFIDNKSFPAGPDCADFPRIHSARSEKPLCGRSGPATLNLAEASFGTEHRKRNAGRSWRKLPTRNWRW